MLLSILCYWKKKKVWYNIENETLLTFCVINKKIYFSGYNMKIEILLSILCAFFSGYNLKSEILLSVVGY